MRQRYTPKHIAGQLQQQIEKLPHLASTLQQRLEVPKPQPQRKSRGDWLLGGALVLAALHQGVALDAEAWPAALALVAGLYLIARK